MLLSSLRQHNALQELRINLHYYLMETDINMNCLYKYD